MQDSDSCPICLDSLDAEESLNMPNCGHIVHVRCALESVQYDARCPLCRCETVTPRRDDFFARFEADLQERVAIHRRYQTNRSRVIRRHNSLRKIRDRIREAERAYNDADRELDKQWTNALKVIWTEDEMIKALKIQRTRCQRRLSRYKLQLRRRLEPMIGEEPIGL